MPDSHHVVVSYLPRNKRHSLLKIGNHLGYLTLNIVADTPKWGK